MHYNNFNAILAGIDYNIDLKTEEWGKFFMQLNTTCDLLIVFLYKSLQDQNISEESIVYKTKINQLLEKLLTQKQLQQLSKEELIREFLPQIIECFLGKQQQFKKYLQEAIEQLNLPAFKLENIFSTKKNIHQ